MKINKIHIKNFKSITTIKLDNISSFSIFAGANGVGKSNIFEAIEFFKKVKLELSNVIWPTKQQVTGMTIIVIVFVLIVSMFLGLFDLGLSTLVQVILT